MTPLSKRERVELALNLEPTDRVPVYDILIHDQAIEHLYRLQYISFPGFQYAP